MTHDLSSREDAEISGSRISAAAARRLVSRCTAPRAVGRVEGEMSVECPGQPLTPACAQ